LLKFLESLLLFLYIYNLYYEKMEDSFTKIKKNGKKEKKNSAAGPSPATIVYKGPVKPPKANNQVETYEFFNSFTTTLSSSAAGQITQVLGSWPSSINDWANVQGTFHEVRTLAMKVMYIPHNRYTRGTVSTTSIGTVVDHTDPGVLASYDAVANHESGKIRSLDDPWEVTAKMSGTEEAQFQDVATAAATGNRFYCKLYSDGLSFSTTYGRLTIQYLYQVRGRK
jgi:hypothetical protein